MERISVGAPSFPQQENFKHHLVQFSLLHLLVVGVVTLAFIGKAAVSEARPSRAPAAEITAPSDSWSPGTYGRTQR